MILRGHRPKYYRIFIQMTRHDVRGVYVSVWVNVYADDYYKYTRARAVNNGGPVDANSPGAVYIIEVYKKC